MNEKTLQAVLRDEIPLEEATRVFSEDILVLREWPNWLLQYCVEVRGEPKVSNCYSQSLELDIPNDGYFTCPCLKKLLFRISNHKLLVYRLP